MKKKYASPKIEVYKIMPKQPLLIGSTLYDENYWMADEIIDEDQII